MADKPHARVNNLNSRATDFGIPDKLTLADVRAISAFYDWTCLKCGAKPAISVDHVIPLSKGGANKRENLQNLCTNCNKAKGDDESDYRKGVICPDDFTPELSEADSPTIPTTSTTKSSRKYRQHDWQSFRLEYITGQMSLRELAESHEIALGTIEYQSIKDDWNKQRQEFQDRISTKSARLIADKEADARAMTFEVGLEIVEDWRRNIKRSTTAAEVTSILKVLLALQGLTTERTNVNVTEEPDEDAVMERISQVFDGARARGGEPSYSPVGEETGAGWSD